MHRFLLLVLTFPCIASTTVFGQVFDEEFNAWPEQTSIGGTVAITSDLTHLDPIKRMLRRVTKDTQVVVLGHRDTKMAIVQGIGETFAGAKVQFGVLEDARSVTTHLDSGGDVALMVLVAPKGAALDGISGAEESLVRYVRGGGRLALVGGAARLAARFVVSSDGSTSKGLNLLPMSALQVSAEIDRTTLLKVLKTHPGTVGIHLPADALLVVKNRTAQVFGDGQALFLLPDGPHHKVREQTLGQQRPGQRPPEFLVDWTEWRRESIDRTLPKFPADKPPVPHVKKGTLLIVGGGGMPSGLMERFVELAGGKEARLVYVPCSEDKEVSSDQGMVRWWKRMGVKDAVTLHTKDRNKANSDEAFLAPLQQATGVWFGGGRQWNMADSYYGTQAQKLMKDVLKRGGVIGGSSAGASIQARYLARATPIENFRIMAPGYERGGLGFIGGVAIDQHFSQRGRQKDMTQLVNRYPQLLGIGLDEATAIEVQLSRAKVVGRGKVFFYDRRTRSADDDPDYVALPAGGEFDLARRVVLHLPESDDENDSESESSQSGEK